MGCGGSLGCGRCEGRAELALLAEFAGLPVSLCRGAERAPAARAQQLRRWLSRES